MVFISYTIPTSLLSVAVFLTGGRSGVQPADSQRAGRQGGAGGGRLQRRDTRLRGHHQIQE